MGWEPLIGYYSYMVGALMFNINTVLGYFSGLTKAESTWIMWFPAVLGSVLFTLGGVLECYHNKVWTCQCTVINWVSISNCLGGMCFLFAASCGMACVEPSKWFVDFPYLVGSLLFLIGSTLALTLWKDESYGLAFINEINIKRTVESRKQKLILD